MNPHIDEGSKRVFWNLCILAHKQQYDLESVIQSKLAEGILTRILKDHIKLRRNRHGKSQEEAAFSNDIEEGPFEFLAQLAVNVLLKKIFLSLTMEEYFQEIIVWCQIFIFHK